MSKYVFVQQKVGHALLLGGTYFPFLECDTLFQPMQARLKLSMSDSNVILHALVPLLSLEEDCDLLEHCWIFDLLSFDILPDDVINI